MQFVDCGYREGSGKIVSQNKLFASVIFRGAYATIAIIVSPLGALRYLNPLNLLNLLNLFSRGAYASIAIIVSP